MSNRSNPIKGTTPDLIVIDEASVHHEFTHDKQPPFDSASTRSLEARLRDEVTPNPSPAPAPRPDPFNWVDVRPLGRNVLPGDILHFGQVLTIEAEPSRNTVLCSYLLDGVLSHINIAGDRRVDACRAIPVKTD